MTGYKSILLRASSGPAYGLIGPVDVPVQMKAVTAMGRTFVYRGEWHDATTQIFEDVGEMWNVDHDLWRLLPPVKG